MPRKEKPPGVSYSKPQVFTRDTEIPILRSMLSDEQTSPIEPSLQQIEDKLDEFIDESNFADNSFSNDDDDNVYREKQNRLNEAWQSIRIQLRDALIELESQHNVEENVCPNGKCVNDELYKSITVDCIYFERKY